MEKFHRSWQKVPRQIRQVTVLVIGISVIIVGIFLLALPGPGWLTIFIGLAILATEFEFADRLKKSAQTKVKNAATAATSKAKRLRKK